jgi:1-acyl-sn-glycerol-3-phosphate acyltransferase
MNGVRQHVKGREHFDPNGAYVICVNHRAIADLFILPASLKGVNYRPLSKVELGSIPVIGYLFRKALVLIDRKDPVSRKKGVETLKELMRTEGVSPLIFPEGTRNRTDMPLKEFYDGAFRIAIECQVPILPTVLLNIDAINPPGSNWLRPGRLYAHFLPPVPTAGLTLEDLDSLRKQVFDLMWAEIEAFIKVHGNR